MWRILFKSIKLLWWFFKTLNKSKWCSRNYSSFIRFNTLLAECRWYLHNTSVFKSLNLVKRYYNLNMYMFKPCQVNILHHHVWIKGRQLFASNISISLICIRYNIWTMFIWSFNFIKVFDWIWVRGLNWSSQVQWESRLPSKKGFNTW